MSEQKAQVGDYIKLERIYGSTGVSKILRADFSEWSDCMSYQLEMGEWVDDEDLDWDDVLLASEVEVG